MQDQRADRRYDRAIAISIGVLALVLFQFVAFKPNLNGVNSDAAVYVLLADFYSPYHDSSITFIDHLFEHYPFPPLYPMVLGIFNGGTPAPLMNYVIGSCLLALALILIFVWIRRQGGDLLHASAVPVLVALTPSTIFIAMGVYSEPLYLVLSFAGFITLLHPTRPVMRWYVSGLLFGLSALARSVGIFAVASFIIYWLLRTRGQRYRMAPLIAVCLPAIWSTLKWARGWHTGYTDSVFKNGLQVGIENIVVQIPVNVEAIWAHFVRSFDLLASPYATAALVILIVPASVAFLRRLRAGEMDALYVGLYLLILVLWPYPNHMQRFLLMILPFFVAYALWGTAELERFSTSVLSARLARWSAVVVFACVIVPSTLFITVQIDQYAETPHEHKTKHPDWYTRDSQAESLAAIDYRNAMLEAIATIEPYVPENECVTSTLSEVIQLHARRKSLRPPLPEAKLDALVQHVTACPYVLMVKTAAFPPVFTFYYPLTELKPQLTLIHSVSTDPGKTEADALLLLARYVEAEPAGIAK